MLSPHSRVLFNNDELKYIPNRIANGTGIKNKTSLFIFLFLQIVSQIRRTMNQTTSKLTNINSI